MCSSRLACGLVLSIGALPVDLLADERPNVILVITDDQGYGDLGATGNPVIRTPNIDAMARRSAVLRNFYVSPVCAPTRACLMSGRYNYRTRCIDTYLGRAMMEPAEITVAELLRASGYATGAFGKWHLGDCYPMRPNDQGFEESLVHRGGGIGQPSDPIGGEGKYSDPVLFHNGRRVQAEGYCTGVYFDAAMEWMESCHTAGRPFFAYLATNCPHGPFHDVPPELYREYGAEDLSNERFPQARGHALPAKVDVDRRARIFAMITDIDRNVGRLFEHLRGLGIERDTVVIFMTDNGPNGNRYVAGMRGWKGHVHEGGIRAPFFVHWPARLQARVVEAGFGAHIDVLPTLLDACGVELPDYLDLDGRSLLPLLAGESGNWPDRTLVIQAHRGDVPQRYHHFALRTERWKLLHASGFGKERFAGAPRFELYDLLADPLEMRDLAAEQPQELERLRRAYDEWFDDVSSTRPDNYAPPRIVVGTPHENPTVLTRQDWRRLTPDSDWGRSSIGCWELRVATAGRYALRFRLLAEQPAAGRLEVRLGTQTLVYELEAGVRECRIDGVELPAGELRLEAVVSDERGRRGVYQVEIHRARRGR